MGTLRDYVREKTAYRVTAAAVVAILVPSGERYVYRGALLPANTRLSQIEHLLEIGYIEKVEVG